MIHARYRQSMTTFKSTNAHATSRGETNRFVFIDSDALLLKEYKVQELIKCEN